MSRGSVNPYINWSDLANYEFDLPPVDEQKRIADLMWAVERHMRAIPIDAIGLVEKRELASILTDSSVSRVAVSNLGSVLMGRQRSPTHATGDHMMPYLRVANVGDNELRLDDVKQMNFSPEEQERYEVRPGDILVSEGQSRELVGQSVLVKELPERMCFQNTLIRFRADRTIIRPEYAQALLRACLRAGIFAGIATQTTSIAHLGARRFEQLHMPVPEMNEQDRFLADLSRVEAASSTACAELNALSALRDRLSGIIFGVAG
jgi:type I restriction enzyme S subunit